MKRSGFTLIELLVVIAIIAILAAILFPVFAQARESARKATCLSNQRQLAMAMRMYMDDYDGAVPFAVFEGNQYSYYWTHAIYPYVKSAAVYTCPTHVQSCTAGDWWTLPLDPAMLKLIPKLSYAMPTAVQDFGHQVGAIIWAPSGQAQNYQPIHMRMEPEIQHPSSTILVIDNWDYTDTRYSDYGNFACLYTTSGGETDNIRATLLSLNAGKGVYSPDIWTTPRHSDGYVVAFADGHTKLKKKGSFKLWHLYDNEEPGE